MLVSSICVSDRYSEKLCKEMPPPLKDHFIYAIPTRRRMHGRTHPPNAQRTENGLKTLVRATRTRIIVFNLVCIETLSAASRFRHMCALCTVQYKWRAVEIPSSHQHTIKSRRRSKKYQNIFQIRIYSLCRAPVLGYIFSALPSIATQRAQFTWALAIHICNVGGFCFLQASANESSSIEMDYLFFFSFFCPTIQHSSSLRLNSTIRKRSVHAARSARNFTTVTVRVHQRCDEIRR